MDDEKLGKVLIGFLCDMITGTLSGSQWQNCTIFREHIPLQRIRYVISSSQHIEHERLALENESQHSRVAAIEKAEKQRYNWHAQGWRHVGRDSSRRGVAVSRDWAPWRTASSWEWHTEDATCT